jgi:hypothetical protein
MLRGRRGTRLPQGREYSCEYPKSPRVSLDPGSMHCSGRTMPPAWLPCAVAALLTLAAACELGHHHGRSIFYQEVDRAARLPERAPFVLERAPAWLGGSSHDPALSTCARVTGAAPRRRNRLLFTRNGVLQAIRMGGSCGCATVRGRPDLRARRDRNSTHARARARRHDASPRTCRP